jgi:phosphate/sulfate permease
LFLLVSGFVAIAFVFAPILAGVLSLCLLALLVWRLAGSEDREGETSEADRENSVWGLIPSWQYTGRHVESGGLARDEQERALESVQQEAEKVERQQRK